MSPEILIMETSPWIWTPISCSVKLNGEMALWPPIDLSILFIKKYLIIILTLLSDFYTFDFTLSKISLLNVSSNATVFIMDQITKVTSKIVTEGGVNNLKSKKKKTLLRNKAKIANYEIRLLEWSKYFHMVCLIFEISIKLFWNENRIWNGQSWEFGINF